MSWNHSSISPLLDLIHTVVPEPHARIDYSLKTLPSFLLLNAAGTSSLILLAYFARSSASRVLRYSFVPVVVSLNSYCLFGYRWSYPGYNVFNWAQGAVSIAILARSIELAIWPKATFQRSNPQDREQSPSPLSDALEVLGAVRGFGYSWSRGLKVPPTVRSPKRGIYLRQTVLGLLLSLLKLDVAETALKFFPRVGEIDGGMFYPSLSFPLKYLTSTFLTIVTGTCILSVVEILYDTACLIGVGVLGHDPISWPPVHENPWKATSVSDLWAYRWHQILRRTFIVLGGSPGYFIGGRVGFVLGTFIASGLLHELSAYAMGRGFEWHPLVFFTLQGVIVIGEKLYESRTGRKIGGWKGRLWAYITVIGLSQPMVDSWLRRSVGLAELHPPSWSPTRWVLRTLGLPTPEGYWV